jgi:uncharacterized cupredoxin-like copper-binding protein
MRRFLVLSSVLAVAVCGTLVALATASSSVHLAARPHALRFTVKTLHAKAGTVVVTMSNPANSDSRHGIAVQGNGLDKDGKIVSPGKTSRLTLHLKKGRYSFYCPVSGHKAAGMKGVLIVS